MKNQTENRNSVFSKDITNIKELLKSYGIDDYDPDIVPKILELTEKILKESNEYTRYFDLPEITTDIVQCTVKRLSSGILSLPVDRGQLLNLARKKNSEPLEILGDANRNPLHLPPPSMCLFSATHSYSPAPSQAGNDTSQQPQTYTSDPQPQIPMYTIPASIPPASPISSNDQMPHSSNLPLKRKADT